jgi:hypothetical protein
MGVVVMDMNHYVLELFVRDRIAEMQARGERSSRIRAAMADARPRRLSLGHALAQLGHCLRRIAGSSGIRPEAGGAAKPRHPSAHGAVLG